MANIESNTLLEKLTQINSIKNRLRQSIVNIGGGDYITEQSPFAAFPFPPEWTAPAGFSPPCPRRR